ncbi:hypothetical protein F5I97DRAFT_530226 [Phlebopus sp. FC_14]|nr:hypothetical protein F5I97DRAFT_530226 [Phlebopus sp. FC_14]
MSNRAKIRLQVLVKERRHFSGAKPPNVSDFKFLCETPYSINAYLEACGISIDEYGMLKPTIRNLTLLYLQDDVPLVRQNSRGVESIIKSVATAEAHVWLSNYDDSWPALLYLQRYWRVRLLYHTYQKSPAEGTEHCRQPPHHIELRGNTQNASTQSKPYASHVTKPPAHDTSTNHQDSDSITDITSSDLNDKNDSDSDGQGPEMSFFDRQVLYLRKKAKKARHIVGLVSCSYLDVSQLL